MKFSLKSSLKALLACAMMLQVGVISAKAEGELSQIDATKIQNVEATDSNISDGRPPQNLIDGNKESNGRWETTYDPSISNRMPVTITFTLDGLYNVGKVILYTDTNKGAPTDFTVSTSTDNSTWTSGTNKTVSQSDMAETGSTPLTVEFTPEEAKYVKVVINHSTATANDYNPADGFVKLTEIELFGTQSNTADTAGLQALYDEVAAMSQDLYTDATWQVLMAAKDAAKGVLDNNPNDKDAVEAAKQEIRAALNGLKDNRIANASILGLTGSTDTSPTKTIDKAFDGDLSTGWETPYNSATLPQSTVMTLDGKYELEQVVVDSTTAKSYLFTKYEIFVSTTDDGDDWQSVQVVNVDVTNAASVSFIESKVRFTPVKAKRVKIEFQEGQSNWVFVGEIELYGNVSKTDLNKAISDAQTAAGANTYTPSSVAALNTAISAAQAVANKTDATAAEIFAQETALATAMNNLVPKTDMTALVNAIANAETEAAKTTVYTTVSIAALQTVIDTAKLLKDNGDATAEQVTAQITALEDAIKALVRLADKTALKAKIDEVKALDTTGKTPNSVSALQDALTAAEAVYNDAQAVQAAADEQVTKLTEAVAKLVDKANIQALTSAITAAEAEVAKTDTYTEASIKAVKAIIAEAVTLRDNKNATQAEVDAKVTRLNDAVATMDKIGETVDKTPLTNLIAAAKTEVAKTDVYTAESLAALQQAIDVAEAAVDTVDSSVAVQEQVDLLQAAIDALEEKGNTPDPTPVDKSDLVTAINDAKAEAAKTDVYTEESIVALLEAIDAAEAVNADENATEEDVTAAIEAINEAVKALVEADDPTPVDPKPEDPKPEDPKPEDPTPETPEESFSATDKATNVQVSAGAGVVDPNAELVVTPVTDTNANDKIATALKSLGGKQLAYDITLLLNNAEIQPNGYINITLNIPKGFVKAKHSLRLYHISDDGKISPLGMQNVTYDDGSGQVFFSVNHLSVYVLVLEDDNATIKPNQPIDKNPLAPSNPVKDTAANAATPNTGDNTMAMTYVMLLVCAGAFLVLSYKRKNDKA